jgi:hypothetical protein
LLLGILFLTWSNCSSCCSLQNTARLLFNSFVLIPSPFWFGFVFFLFFFWGGLVHCFWTNIKSRSILVDGYYIHD